MRILKKTIKIVIVFFNILSCFCVAKVHAKITIVYYCETKDGNRGYYDRPCQLFDNITKQTILSLQNGYTKTPGFKINLKQQRCNNIESKIILLQRTLQACYNKSTIIRLKRKLFKYQLFIKNNCNTTG